MASLEKTKFPNAKRTSRLGHVFFKLLLTSNCLKKKQAAVIRTPIPRNAKPSYCPVFSQTFGIFVDQGNLSKSGNPGSTSDNAFEEYVPKPSESAFENPKTNRPAWKAVNPIALR
jgi:hypothetical protein